MEQLERLAPYIIQYNKILALFGEDPDLHCVLDHDTHTCTIYTNSYYKADILRRYLVLEPDNLKDAESNKSKKGVHALYIDVICVDAHDDPMQRCNELNVLFENNKHFDNAKVISDETGHQLCYCTFKDETIQYPADNRFVIHGYQTTLAEDIIKDLFTHEARRAIFVTKEKEEEE